MAQKKTVTIRKLRTANLHLVDVVVKTMRAAGASDDEIVARLREDFTEALPLSDAIKSALAHPVRAGATVGAGPKVGAGTFQPVSKETGERLRKARAERDKTEAAELAKTRADLRSRRVDH